MDKGDSSSPKCPRPADKFEICLFSTKYRNILAFYLRNILIRSRLIKKIMFQVAQPSKNG